jgi:uncharacterized protein (DUF111 family)
LGSGYGFGTRKLPGISNCVRVLAFEAAEDFASERVAVLECEIDDQSAEDLASGIERLRATAGVLDVIQAPAFGKKGRMVTQLRALAKPEACEQVLAAIFVETTTIGVRHALVERRALPRRAEAVEIDGQTVRRKVVERPSGPTAKAEADDVGGAGGHAARKALRRRAEDL